MSEWKKARNIAIVLSAGRGSRMHTQTPKQYLDLCGRPVIAWSLGAFEAFDGVDDVILVSSPEDIEYCRSEIVEAYGLSKVRRVIPGGAERYLSVWEGLKEAKRIRDQGQEGPADGGYLFVHDGARPLVDSAILERTLADAGKYRACVAAMPVKDTIKVSDEEGFAAQTPDRRLLWQIQTPQVFSYGLILQAYEDCRAQGMQGITDDAMVVEKAADTKVYFSMGSYQNIKITTPEDLVLAEAFMK